MVFALLYTNNAKSKTYLAFLILSTISLYPLLLRVLLNNACVPRRLRIFMQNRNIGPTLSNGTLEEVLLLLYKSTEDKLRLSF